MNINKRNDDDDVLIHVEIHHHQLVYQHEVNCLNHQMDDQQRPMNKKEFINKVYGGGQIKEIEQIQ